MSHETQGGACPIPNDGHGERILLAHGEGGRLMRELIQDRIVAILTGGEPLELADAALLAKSDKRLAITTDSYVVSPLCFPGGDIGSLAVFGTVNDLAVSGAVARWLSLSLIIEEGFYWQTLDGILQSIAAAAKRTGVAIVAGDTKVVPRGMADGLFINTTGIGELLEPAPAGPRSLTIGDRLIVSGPIGQHGVAVMTAREQLAFHPRPISDSAPLDDVTAALRAANIPVRAMRDATRGGVAAVLHEWSAASGYTMRIESSALPVSAEVQGVCELLGLDPLHVANEGTMVVAVPPEAAAAALDAMRAVSQSAKAARIGEVVPSDLTPVVMRQVTGVDVPIDEPLGAPLPRIC